MLTPMQMENIILRPHWMQYGLCEMPMIIISIAALFASIFFSDTIYNRYIALAAFFVWAVLAYRILFIRRIRYVITDQQILYQHGIVNYTTDYLELYRVFDYQQVRSPMQQLVGLKTIYVMAVDRNTPVLTILGIRNNIDVISIIRNRVEYNKALKHVYEIGNRY